MTIAFENPVSELLTRDHGPALAVRKAELRPRSFDPAARTIEAIVATSSPVLRYDDDGEFLEILDSAGAVLNKVPGRQVLNNHQRDDLRHVLGKVLDCWREDDQIIARLRLSSSARHADIIDNIADGTLSAISVGYHVTKWREGRNAQGQRTKTAIEWEPLEVSFVAIAADARARTRDRAAVNQEIRSLCRQARVPRQVEDDLLDRAPDLETVRAELVDFMDRRERERPISAVVTGDDPMIGSNRAIGDALYSKMSGTAPTGQARELVHRSMIDLMAEHARANGIRLRSTNPMSVFEAVMMTRAGAPHTTSDFPIILADTMQKRLGELFRIALTGSSAIAAPVTVNDFRTVTEGRLTSFPSLEPVNEAGEITYGTLEEEGERYAITSFARAVGVTFQVLVNDNLGAVDRSIRDVAFAAAARKAQLVLAALTMSLRDGKTLYHEDHKNLAASGGAPDETTLSTARTAMMKQSPVGSSEPLGITPAILLVPAELQTTAEKLIATINPVQVDDVNVFSGKLQIATEPRLPTTTEWHLFASPGVWPAIKFASLAGFDMPMFEMNQEFSRLGTSYRTHWHVGAAPVDYRGCWKNTGAGG